MHRNPVWLTFLSITALIVGWYTINAAIVSFRFISQSKAAEPKTLTWSLKKINDEHYVIVGKYELKIGDNVYFGETTLPFSYLNAYAAEKNIDALKLEPWKIWYSPTNPDNSTLQKQSPLKDCIYAAILWALLIYFISLGYRIRQAV